MIKAPTGGPAFTSTGDTRWANTGMSLRDFFAAQAMNGFNLKMAQSTLGWPAAVLDEHAEQAYRIADAMLKARQTQ